MDIRNFETAKTESVVWVWTFSRTSRWQVWRVWKTFSREEVEKERRTHLRDKYWVAASLRGSERLQCSITSWFSSDKGECKSVRQPQRASSSRMKEFLEPFTRYMSVLGWSICMFYCIFRSNKIEYHPILTESSFPSPADTYPLQSFWTRPTER